MGGPQVLWWKSGLIPPLGVYPYWTDPFSLFFIEIIAVQFAELKRCGRRQTWVGSYDVVGMHLAMFQMELTPEVSRRRSRRHQQMPT